MTYAELVAERDKLCEILRNSPISAIHSDDQRSLKARIDDYNQRIVVAKVTYSGLPY